MRFSKPLNYKHKSKAQEQLGHLHSMHTAMVGFWWKKQGEKSLLWASINQGKFLVTGGSVRPKPLTKPWWKKCARIQNDLTSKGLPPTVYRTWTICLIGHIQQSNLLSSTTTQNRCEDKDNPGLYDRIINTTVYDSVIDQKWPRLESNLLLWPRLG